MYVLRINTREAISKGPTDRSEVFLVSLNIDASLQEKHKIEEAAEAQHDNQWVGECL